MYTTTIMSFTTPTGVKDIRRSFKKGPRSEVLTTWPKALKAPLILLVKRFITRFEASTIVPQITGVKLINKAATISRPKVFLVLKPPRFKAVAMPMYAKPKINNVFVMSLSRVQPILITGLVAGLV